MGGDNRYLRVCANGVLTVFRVTPLDFNFFTLLCMRQRHPRLYCS